MLQVKICKTLTKRVYGVLLVYPDSSCPNALALIRLTGQKTFSQDHLTTIAVLGYRIVNTNVI